MLPVKGLSYTQVDTMSNTPWSVYAVETRLNRGSGLGLIRTFETLARFRSSPCAFFYLLLRAAHIQQSVRVNLSQCVVV